MSDTLVSRELEIRGGKTREKESELGGKRKQNLQHRRKQVTNIQRMQTLGMCHLTMHVTCCAVSLDQL